MYIRMKDDYSWTELRPLYNGLSADSGLGAYKGLFYNEVISTVS